MKIESLCRQMGLSKEVGKAIAELPGNGEWWKQDSARAFVVSASKMDAEGMGDNTIIDILTDLYGACAAEFGS